MMGAMDSAAQIAVLVVLAVLVVGVVVLPVWARKAYKKDAYRLLEEADPGPQDIRETVKNLARFVGSWNRDEEAAQLIRRLLDRLKQSPE